MIRPRVHKIISDLVGNKARSLLVVASITVGLFAVGLITSMYVIINEDMRAGYASANPAQIMITASPFNWDFVDHIRRLEGVKWAEGVRTFTLRVQTGPDQWIPIDIKAVHDIQYGLVNLSNSDPMDASNAQKNAIDKVTLQQGTWPPGKHEIVVDKYKLPELITPLGGEMTIELASGGQTRQVRLVGVVQDQTIGAGSMGGGFFLSNVQGTIDWDNLTWLDQPETMNQLLVTVTGDANDAVYLRQVANQINTEVENNGGTVISSSIRAADNHPNSVYVKAIASVLLVLGFLVVFLSGFLITNTLSALLAQQIHQIGVMKTVGARRGQIMGIYMLLILIFGLTAFVIAMPLSSRIAYFLLEFVAGKINMELQGYRLIPLATIIQLAIAVIIPQAAAFLPIYQGTRVSAVEALNGYSLDQPPSRKGWIDRNLERLRGVSRPLLISLRNTFRKKGRLALTLLTLSLGGAIFIGTFNVQISLGDYIKRVGRYYLADVNLTLGQFYRVREVERVIKQIPEVKSVEGWIQTRGEVILPDGSTGETIAILAPPASSTLVKSILLEGRWFVPGDQNAVTLSERFRELLPNLKVGDMLWVKINGRERDLKIVGFFQLAGKSSGYLAYSTYEYLSEIVHESGRANTFRVLANHTGLTIQEQENLSRRIEDLLKANDFTVMDTRAGLYITATTTDGLNVLTTFLLMMASLIAIVGSIGLTGALSLNVLERIREIGIMRAIGAGDRAVMNMVMVEGALIGLISWILGTILSFPISSLMSNAVNLALFGAPSAFTFSLTGILLWLVVVGFLSVIASVMPARDAARLTIREVLSYE